MQFKKESVPLEYRSQFQFIFLFYLKIANTTFQVINRRLILISSAVASFDAAISRKSCNKPNVLRLSMPAVMDLSFYPLL